MSGSVAYRVVRGLAYRACWVSAFLAYLALALVAFIALFGVLAAFLDPGALRSGPARLHVTVWERVLMAVTCATFGLLAAFGARKLRDYHRRINTLDPEMQVDFRTARPAAGTRRSEDWPVRSDGPTAMYDTQLDGGLVE